MSEPDRASGDRGRGRAGGSGGTEGAGARESVGEQPPARWAVFTGGHAATTIGMLLVITAIAFEGMGVSAAMPAIMSSLGAVESYAWPFVAFLASQVFATVLGGRWADRTGPAAPLTIGVVIFSTGLVVAALATTLPVLLVGRMMQGFGAGAASVSVFVLIAHVYDARLRPVVFAWVSAAWVLPALAGPPASAWIAQAWSWHWVFGAIAPVGLLALTMLTAALRRFRRGQRVAGEDDSVSDERAGVAADNAEGVEGGPVTSSGAAQRMPREVTSGPRSAPVVLAALVAAAGVTALTWAGERPSLAILPVAVLALVGLVPAVLRLVPTGTLTARSGVGVAVLLRGLLVGSFFSMTSLLPLVLTDTYGWRLDHAGIALIVGSVGWSLGSALQSVRPTMPREQLVRAGAVMLAVAVVLVGVATTDVAPAQVVVAGAVAGGLGMGLASPSISILIMGHSGEDELGRNTAAAQIMEGLMAALLVGAGGALAALLGLAAGYPTLLGVLLVIALVAAGLAPRAALQRR